MTPEQQADLDAWNRLSRFEYDSARTQRAFREWFGAAPGEARVLECLYLHRGEFVPLHELANQAKLKAQYVRAAVGSLCEIMATGSIVTDRDERCVYGLTTDGFEDCIEALADLGQRGGQAA